MSTLGPIIMAHRQINHFLRQAVLKGIESYTHLQVEFEFHNYWTIVLIQNGVYMPFYSGGGDDLHISICMINFIHDHNFHPSSS
jgi:hypothetical protein